MPQSYQRNSKKQREAEEAAASSVSLVKFRLSVRSVGGVDSDAVYVNDCLDIVVR